MTGKILGELFSQMYYLRLVEEEIASRYKDQEMRCPVHLCIGQEAVAVGVSAVLRPEDVVFSSHRSHGHFLARGGSLKAMLAEMYGKSTGCASGIGGSQHLIDLSVNFLGATPIVAETIPLSVGTALAAILKGEKRISVTFFGDGAMEEGITQESLNFAKLKKLPVLFVCENNYYSTYTPIKKRQPQRAIYTLAAGHGISAFQGDGNDLVNVYKLALKAVKMIRAGKGPVFLEFLTYRLREHVGPNLDPVGYRPKSEYSFWKKRDPLILMEKVIKKRGLNRYSTEFLKKKYLPEIYRAFDFARSSPYPGGKVTVEQIYG